MDTFTIDGTEYPIVAPKGRKGRKATAFILGKFGEKAEVTFSDVLELFASDDFEDHLPGLLGVSAEILEESGDTGEILSAMFSCIEKIYAGLSREEVETAVKNSNDTPGEEKQEKKTA